jgi:hypothetical protein
MKKFSMFVVIVMMCLALMTIPQPKTVKAEAELFYPHDYQIVPIYQDLQVNIDITSQDFFSNSKDSIGYALNGIRYEANWSWGVSGTRLSFWIPSRVLQYAKNCNKTNIIALSVFQYDKYGYYDTLFDSTIHLVLVTNSVSIRLVRYDTSQIPWRPIAFQASDPYNLDEIESFHTIYSRVGENQLETLWMNFKDSFAGLAKTESIILGPSADCSAIVLDIWKTVSLSGIPNKKILLHLSTAYPDSALETIDSLAKSLQGNITYILTSGIKGESNYYPNSCYGVSWTLINN